MTTIWVVGMAPDCACDVTVGGFDWYLKFEDAAEQLRSHLEDGPGYDFIMRRVETPLDNPDKISIWLDKHRQLWDPAA